MTKRLVISLIYLLTALPAAAGGVGAEPLTLRVNNATAVPGGIAAVVLRTYEARPIRQGQICLAVRLLQRGSKELTPGGRQNRGAGGPFNHLEGYTVFSSTGDVLDHAEFMPGQSDQVTMLQFESAAAGINASDGPLLVLNYRVRLDVLPGEQYDLEVDLPNTTLIDADGNPILTEARNGLLNIRHPAAPVNAEAAAEEPDIWQTVLLSLQTDESIGLSSGQVGFRYSSLLLPGRPKVHIDPRHGDATWTAVYSRDLVVVQFESPDNSLNIVPGNIVSLHLPYDAGAVAGRAVWLDPGLTYLYDSKGSLLVLDLEGDIIP